MKKLEIEQMEQLGGSWGSCAWGIAGMFFAGSLLAAATGGWIIVAGSAYLITVYDATYACMNAGRE